VDERKLFCPFVFLEDNSGRKKASSRLLKKCSLDTLFQQPAKLQIIGEVSDGLAAVDEAAKLKPDLILLDIGLPMLDGIAAARKIRKIAPKSRILFLSQEFSAEVGREALKFGAGFVVKSDAFRELLPAINAVILPYLSSKIRG
jgi:DNA-binding NarL/FixJ family response regulator